MPTNQTRQPEGTPTGGQWKATSHSDAVPTLGSPAADPLDALAAARLRISAQRQYLKDQELALKAAHDRIAGASAAASLREQFPTAATAVCSRNNFDAFTLEVLLDSAGNPLTDDDRLSGYGRYNPAFQEERSAVYAAMRHLDNIDREALAVQGVTTEHGKEILHLDAAIASVDAGLDVEPDPYTDPLSAHTRKLLVDAAREGRSKMAAKLFVNEGVMNPADEEELRYQVDALDRIFGNH